MDRIAGGKGSTWGHFVTVTPDRRTVSASAYSVGRSGQNISNLTCSERFTPVSVANPWGYAGGYTDPTGLVKFGTRYYDPTLGRWTQQDPLVDGCVCQVNRVNLYAYAADNPVYVTDPTGTQVYRWCWLADVFCWAGYWWLVIECILIFMGRLSGSTFGGDVVPVLAARRLLHAPPDRISKGEAPND